MTRSDIVYNNILRNLPISYDGMNDGMWIMIIIFALILLIGSSLKSRYTRPPYYPPYHPTRRPPNYPPRYPPYW